MPSNGLDRFFEVQNDDEIKGKIRHRRSQILVHSCLYYEMNTSIVSDHKWQEWADELELLQNENPDCCKIDFFDYEFRDWTGATGNHLPMLDPWVSSKARWLLQYHEERFHGNND
jgi:hypothetical protein